MNSIKLENQGTLSKNDSVPANLPRTQLNNSKPIIFPDSFSENSRPHHIFIRPEQNAFRQIFSNRQVEDIYMNTPSEQFIQPGSSSYSKPKSRHRGVKVEEVEDEVSLLRGSPSAIRVRSGPRRSEPSIDLANQLNSMRLNETTPTPALGAKEKSKPRISEPVLTSFRLPEHKSPTSQNRGTVTASPSNPMNPAKAAYKLFNQHQSYDYGQIELSLPYSPFILEPHQAHGRIWMAELESEGRSGGILADEMGLGKTLQTLVRIKEDKMAAIARGETVGPTLIVGPKSVLLQWDEEARRVFHSNDRLSCVIYHGSQRERKFPPSELQRKDIVLTTYGILSSEHRNSQANDRKSPPNLFKIFWHRLVLDEAHEIRNSSTSKAEAAFAVRAKLIWCLTGTPIQNKIRDLFSLFHLLRIKDFSDRHWFDKKIAVPIDNMTVDSELAQRLLKFALGNIMLRRLKTDLINGHPILQLPELRVMVLDCDLSPSERGFYDVLEARMQEILKTLSRQLERGDITFYSTAWVLLLRLRQACLHPALMVVQKVEDAANDAGAKDKLDVAEADEKCPLCRNKNKSFAHKEACKQYIEMARSLMRDQPSTKIKITLEILRDIRARPGNEKTIIFSQFTSMLTLIEPFLLRGGIRFSRLDGTMEMNSRQKELSDFKNNPQIPVILVSLKAGGTGLNLTECNNVILFDLWWNPAVEEQAFSRAHRMGQTKNVNVYKLVTTHTVERRIMELQDKKRKLAMESLDRDEIENMKKLPKEELLHLLACHP